MMDALSSFHIFHYVLYIGFPSPLDCLSIPTSAFYIFLVPTNHPNTTAPDFSCKVSFNTESSPLCLETAYSCMSEPNFLPSYHRCFTFF